MTKNITLNKLAEEIIRESKRPFTINDFARNLETRWQKQISDSSLKKVRQILLNHHSLIGIKENDFVPLRREMQMVFQDPFSSLNPRMTVRQIIEEPLVIHGEKDKTHRLQLVSQMLDRVQLAKNSLTRYPHAFSGGQRQRIGIARALVLNPSFIVCDESVSALDVSVQAQIINLLEDLQEELGLTYLFVAHDLAVVRHICDRVLVMRDGKVVERGNVEKVFSEPQENYTKLLLSAIPSPDPDIKLNPLDRKSLGLE